MSFFGNIGKKIASAAKTIYNATINRPPQTIINQKSGGVEFTIKSSVSNANAVNQALFHIFLSQEVRAQTLDAMGKEATRIIQEIVEPLRRKQSGSFVDSFKHRVDMSNNSVTIYSDHPAAYAIQYGINKVGEIQSIQDWMKTKPEFGGLNAKEERRVAYAIKKSIDRGDAPGPKSTLGQLSPQGERRFDYVGEATHRLENEIEQMLQNVASGLTGP